MFAPKPISEASVAGALAKAERYRLLNEPTEAESICLDILEIDRENQDAIVCLILALTDQVAQNTRAFPDALSVVDRLQSPYDRAYYAGIVWERRAKTRYHDGGQGGREYVYQWLVRALQLFEEAERLRAPGNDDAVLRWNACVRFLGAHRELAPPVAEPAEPILSE